MIKFHIDTPLESRITVDKDFQVSGWGISKNKIKNIAVYINDELHSTVHPAIERSDVLMAFPDYSNSLTPGFNQNIDIESLRLGENNIVIKIKDFEGNEEAIIKTIDKTENHREYHDYYINKRKSASRVLPYLGERVAIELYVLTETIAGLSPTLKSLINQTYENLEIKLLPLNLAGSEEIESYLRKENISNVTICDEVALNSHENEYVGFIRGGEVLDPIGIEQWVGELSKYRPDICYSDNDYYLENGLHCKPNFKPDWSYDYQLSKDYVGGVYLVRKSKENTDLINGTDFRKTSVRYALFLTLLTNKPEIYHVQDVLWSSSYNDDKQPSELESEAEIVRLHLENNGVEAAVETEKGIRYIKRSIDAYPKVSIIIPTTGRPDLLVPCVESILEKTEYKNYELIFLDNGRGRYPDGIEFLKNKDIKVIERNEKFNWALLNNVGAEAAEGEVLLFLNDDIEVTDGGWLESMVIEAVRPEVGCVGGLLLYPDGNIQHAGVFLVDHGGGARHWLHFLNPKKKVYQDLDKVVREVTANTGACLMMRRDVFEEVGGFDEELAVVGNDIDICLQLLDRNYKNIWTPKACMIHHESVSRKNVVYTDDEKRMWAKWENKYLEGDVYYNPNLSLNTSDCSLAQPALVTTTKEEVNIDYKFGVNLIGYIKAEMGVGEGARGIAKALEAAKIPFCIVNYEEGNPSRMRDNSWEQKIVDTPIYNINILHINADCTPSAVDKLPETYFKDKYTIGFWAWELPEFPDRWIPSFSCVDEVWCPSSFVQQAIKVKSPVPVNVFPHPIEKEIVPYLKRSFFELPEDKFLFLSMYDTHSVQERKNPRGVITAFQQAFTSQDDSVGLVVKVNNANENELIELNSLIHNYSNIYLITETLQRHDVDSLIEICDCFVSLHRSEGFGLVMAESMSLGTPVIATNWSGNIDFMNEENSGCVNYELKKLGQDYGPYESHQYWAEPSLEHTVELMRKLFSDSSYRKAIKKSARQMVEKELSANVIGEKIKRRIMQITREFKK